MVVVVVIMGKKHPQQQQQQQQQKQKQDDQKQKLDASQRLKREDCRRVKHDSLFSEWKILVGASDWQDHAAGKEGVAKYRLHNLPSCDHTGPGVYELGIFPRVLAVRERPVRRIQGEDVVAVYLGEAENVRQRLQRYGQAGSHLEVCPGFASLKVAGLEVDGKGSGRARVLLSVTDDGAWQGPQLFTRVFAEGRSIVFRWALAQSKDAAKRVEGDLLAVFDYAWNRDKNGCRRPHDITLKLHVAEQTVSCYSAFSYLAYIKWVLTGRPRRGIAVAVSNPKAALKQHERIMASVVQASEALKVKETKAAAARKRSNPKPPAAAKQVEPDDVQGLQRKVQASRRSRSSGGTLVAAQPVCGVVLHDGNTCNVAPRKGRKRCTAHKGMRVRLRSS